MILDGHRNISALAGRVMNRRQTEDGELLASGDGRHGHLGLGAVLHQQEPARARGPEPGRSRRLRL